MFAMRLLGCYFTTFFLTLSLSAQTMVDGFVVSTQNTGTDNATNDYIHLYQNHISELKSVRCAMYPSCSNYGLMVYSDKKFFEATTLLCDRLIRCSHDKKFYHETYGYGYKSLEDIPYYKSNGKQKIKASFPRAEILKNSVDSATIFINHLINEQAYSSALLEIERLRYTRKTLSPSLYLKKLQCLRGMGQHEKALYEYEINIDAQLKEAPEIQLEIALINYLLSNYTATIELTQNIEKGDTLFLEAGTLHALSLAKEGELTESKAIFEKLSITYPERTVLKNNLLLCDELLKTKEKNPTTAKILSIIPGAGYLYAGHRGSALTSLFINSLLAYATFTSIKKENYGVAGIMGFFSISFYIGNITGASRCVTRYNKKTRNDIISTIERRNNIFY